MVCVYLCNRGVQVAIRIDSHHHRQPWCDRALATGIPRHWPRPTTALEIQIAEPGLVDVDDTDSGLKVRYHEARIHLS